MKKIIVIFCAFLSFFFLPAISSAAQKTMTSSSPTYQYNVSRSSDPKISKSKTHFGVLKNETGSTTTNSSSVTTSDFPPVVNTTSAISVDASSGSITLINSNTETSGAVWYSGTGSSETCNACTDGICKFGIGFRAYFAFKTLKDTSVRSDAVISNGTLGPGGDGFAFAVLNASDNGIDERGGIPMRNGSPVFSIGSLLGYAGPGNTSNNKGLTPPKFAIEFDLYPNNTSGNICSSARYDNAGSYDTYGSYGNTSNHIALMFWGKDETGKCNNYQLPAVNAYPQSSFDDTYHGAGDGTTANPYNSSLSGNGSGLGGYYERSRSSNGGTYNWMEDGEWHFVRVEAIRDPTLSSYQIKAWVDCESCTSSPCTPCTGNEYIYFQDVYNAYNNTSYPPKIDRTVTLDSTYSGKLDTILFGFTEGSGQVTQTITITNFAIYFPTSSIACAAGANYTCTTSPIGASHTYSAATGTVNVKVAATCALTAEVANAGTTSWLSITSVGSNTVTYHVDANTGAARTGRIIITGQTYTVTQAAGPPSCTLTANAAIVAYNSTNTLTWTVSGTPTSATWTTSPGGTCGSPNIAGGSCTTANQTTAGKRTYTLNVSNSNGDGSCSAEFYVGCQGYTVYNNTGSRRDFRITNSSCSRTSNGSAISGTLNTSETATRYSTNNTSCGSAQGSINYTNAMNADIAANGGNGNCVVNYNSNNTASDR